MKQKKENRVALLLRWAGSQKIWLFLAILLSAVSGLCIIVPYIGIYRLMDATFNGVCTKELVVQVVTIIAVAVALRFALFGCSGVAAHKGAYGALFKVRCMVAEHMARAPLGALNERRTGDIKTVLNEDIEKLELFLAHNLPDLVCYLVGPVVIFIYLLTVNIPLAVISLVPLVLAIAVMGVMFRNTDDLMERANRSITTLNSVMIEYISGMKLIKAYNMGSRSFQKFSDAIHEENDMWNETSRRMGPPYASFVVIIECGMLLMVPLGGMFFLKGSLAASAFLLFVYVGSMYLTEIRPLQELGTNFANVLNAITKTKGILDIPIYEGGTDFPKNHDIELRNVRFSYDGKTDVLKGVNLKIKNGERMALVGQSGAGKSTVIELISRFYDVQEGEVLIGGRNVKELDYDTILKNVAIVFQKTFLTRDSVLENIRIVSVSEGMVTMGDNGSAVYRFSVSTAGTYDVAVRLCFPFWDKNGIYISIDGSRKHFTESRLWWPYWRTTFWSALAEGISLSAGTHTITVSVDVKGVQFYGFRVCSAFSEEPSAGSATYTLAPRKFKDVDGNMAQPDRGFKLTLEMLRRKPDSALIWYEDFRDENPLPETYWTTLSGKWQVWREGYENRPYSQLEGSGQLAWKYSGFKELHLRARLAFPADGSGKAGVFCGDVFCCLNIDTQRVELYKDSTLLGSYSQTISRTSNADLRGNPTMYTVEMRIRGNRVRVYSGASYMLRFTASLSGFSGGYAGYRSDNRTVCELMRLGDAWTYEPYERFDVRMPDGGFKSFGRISRSNIAWDEEFQVFTLTADVEESSTRSEDISMDYDFFHSDLMEISCGNNYTAEVIPKDINIWISRLFLGDADGFSILYYQDVDSLVYWANQAAYRWKLRGMCMWSLGQEDMRLWEWLPKQI